MRFVVDGATVVDKMRGVVYPTTSDAVAKSLCGALEVLTSERDHLRSAVDVLAKRRDELIAALEPLEAYAREMSEAGSEAGRPPDTDHGRFMLKLADAAYSAIWPDSTTTPANGDAAKEERGCR